MRRGKHLTPHEARKLCTHKLRNRNHKRQTLLNMNPSDLKMTNRSFCFVSRIPVIVHSMILKMIDSPPPKAKMGGQVGSMQRQAVLRLKKLGIPPKRFRGAKGTKRACRRDSDDDDDDDDIQKFDNPLTKKLSRRIPSSSTSTRLSKIAAFYCPKAPEGRLYSRQ
mmetsp:Transcript_26726/g.64993  ORF Transcript_26726/g.64993 Transcript_26726/m.64993 type:complete len:165 (-) Transcript_26726:324-818(-)